VDALRLSILPDNAALGELDTLLAPTIEPKKQWDNDNHAETSKEIMRLIEEWSVEDILVSDKHLGEYLNQQRLA
jgi:hypothetical protein